MTVSLRIGTRGSPLALWQARFVADRMRANAPEQSVELIEIETTGDQVRDVPLAHIGGDGLFTKAIQEALRVGKVDIAVHSLKDLPTTLVPGLKLGAVPPRGPTGDVFVSRQYQSFDALPGGGTVATSSPRRKAQVLHRRPDLQLVNIRGNVETRLRKLVEENLDGVLLAQAGLERLGLANQITEILDPTWMLPAVGQGALGLECRSDDAETQEVLSKLNDPPTFQAVLGERALLRGLGGGCHVPIGAATSIHGATFTLRGVVLSPDGSQRVDGQISGPLVSAEALGQQLAKELWGRGARELLQGP